MIDDQSELSIQSPDQQPTNQCLVFSHVTSNPPIRGLDDLRMNHVKEESGARDESCSQES